MTQTPRSIAALEALLADNSEREISARDVRDFLESALGCYGELAIESGSTAEGLTGTPAEINTWLTSGPARNTTPDLVNGRLQLDSDGLWRIDFSASFLVTAASDRFLFQLRSDQVLIAGAQRDITGVLGERMHVHVSRIVSMTSGAEVSVFGSAFGAVGDVTLEHANLSAHRVG